MSGAGEEDKDRGIAELKRQLAERDRQIEKLEDLELSLSAHCAAATLQTNRPAIVKIVNLHHTLISDMTRLACLVRSAAVPVLGLVLVGVWFCACEKSPNHWPRQSFNSTEWKTLPPGERYRMVRDLLDSGRLQGQKKDAVITLLGKPSYEAPDGSYVTYVVKHVSPNVKSFDFVHILHIAFDASGKVVSVRSRTD